MQPEKLSYTELPIISIDYLNVYYEIKLESRSFYLSSFSVSRTDPSSVDMSSMLRADRVASKRR